MTSKLWSDAPLDIRAPQNEFNTCIRNIHSYVVVYYDVVAITDIGRPSSMVSPLRPTKCATSGCWRRCSGRGPQVGRPTRQAGWRRSPAERRLSSEDREQKHYHDKSDSVMPQIY